MTEDNAYISKPRRLTQSEQEEMLMNQYAWHDLATLCWAKHATKRVFHPPQGYDASRRTLSSKDIFTSLRSSFPAADDDHILYAGRQMRKIIRNIVKKGIIIPPGVYH